MKVTARDILHPEDKAALDNLKSIPMLSSCVQMFMKLGIERMSHGQNMAQKIRLGPQQLPEIYKYMPVACEALGIPEPEFYLEMSPYPNAYTFGESQPYITVTSALLDLMEEDELQAVIAHECGHILCQHTLYRTMAVYVVMFGSQIFGPLAALSMPVQSALFYWMRRSELSADRAAALVMKGPQPVVDTMVRLAGGPKSITSKINMDLYIEQAAAYDKLLESKWDKFLQNFAFRMYEHPVLSLRSREIIKWCESDHFQKILQGLEEKEEAVPVCSACEKPLSENWKFCRHCGASNPNFVVTT